MSHIFISHVEEDARISLEVAQGLEQAGYKTWYFERDSIPGPSYLGQVSKAIEESPVMIVIISPASLRSHQVTNEVVRAYESGKSFVPVLYKVTHAQFQKQHPVLRQAMGSAASISIPGKNLSVILPRIIAGLNSLNVLTDQSSPYRKTDVRKETGLPQEERPIVTGKLLLILFSAIIVTGTILGYYGFMHRKGNGSSQIPSQEAMLLVEVVDSLSNPLSGVALKVKDGDTLGYTDSEGGLAIKLTDEREKKDTLYFALTKNRYNPVYSYLTIKDDSALYTRRYVMDVVRYALRFIFHDESGKPIKDVAVWRYHKYKHRVGTSNSKGELTNYLLNLDSPIKYEFQRVYYQKMPWTASKKSFPEFEHTSQMEKTVELQKLSFTVQCLDTTGLYADSLKGIKIDNLSESLTRYTNINGKSKAFPLKYSNTEVRVKFSKEPIFPAQIHETKVEDGKIARIILNPRKGEMTLKVIEPAGPTSSPVIYATVTIKGVGYQDSKTTNSDGVVVFQSPRIRPFQRFQITVEKGSKRQTYDLWSKGWDTEEKLTFSSSPEETGETK